MHVTKGQFSTPNASKYLQQLCKHFAHKVEVDYDPQQGRVSFPFGKAVLSASDTSLSVEIAAEAPEALQRAKSVIDIHLVRFAFREDFKSMDWCET